LFNSVFTHYVSCKTNPTPFVSAQRLSERTVFKDTVGAVKQTLSVSCIKSNPLKFYKEAIIVCSEIRTKHKNASSAELKIFNVKTGGMLVK
jgi:hypothetical protein